MMKEKTKNERGFITDNEEKQKIKDSKKTCFSEVKKKYNLMFHADRIDIPNNCTSEEYQKAVQRHYREKANLHQKLGAEKFQKVVFKVEKMKYKVLKKSGNGFVKLYDKASDKKRDKILKKKHCKQEIVDVFRKEKMLLRKEMIYEKNRNYHMELDSTSNFMKYLDWNKQIHKEGLKSNGLVIVGAILGTIVGIPPIITVPLLAVEMVCAGINAQCINLQEFNISRLKEKEDKLNRIRTKKMERDVEKYQHAATPVTKAFAKTQALVKPEDIVEHIESVEQLKQLRELIHSTQKQRNVIEPAKTIQKRFNMNKR